MDTIVETIQNYFLDESLLAGKHVLISAGPTQESLDPARYITNHSSGKQGYAIAKAVSLAVLPYEIPTVSGVVLPLSISTASAGLFQKDYLNLPLPSLRDSNLLAEVARAALDLDLVVQELLEGGEVEDLVGHGLRAVDHVLYTHISLATIPIDQRTLLVKLVHPPLYSLICLVLYCWLNLCIIRVIQLSIST